MNRRRTVYGFTAIMLLTFITLRAPGGPTTKSTRAALQQTAAATETSTGDHDHPLLNPCSGQPFTTVMTGAGLATAEAVVNGVENQYVVNFTLAQNDEATNFGSFTASHLRQPMAIVLDGQVVSAPVIQAALTTGGVITGNFTQADANTLAVQFRYGALPVILHVESTNQTATGLQVILAPDNGTTVGATRLDEARQIIERRVTASGVVGAVVKVTSDNHIEVDLPSGIRDPQAIIDLISKRALLEFVDFSQPAGCTASMPKAGQFVLTDKQISLNAASPTAAATGAH